MRVFVSYRREDSGAHAGRLRDGLANKLGERNVFLDVSAIAPGVDFEQAIESALNACDAVLVTIGPRWLHVGPSGDSRLHDSDDYIRFEIRRALAADVPVVPVLVGRAVMPSADDLPDDIRDLVLRQAVVLRDEKWHEDLAGLIRSLRGENATSRPGRHLLLGVLVLAALILVGSLLLSDGGGETPKPPTCDAPNGTDWTRFAGPDAMASIQLELPTGRVEFVVTDAFYRPTNSGWQVVVDAIVSNDAELRYFDQYDFERLEVDRFPSAPATCFLISAEPLDSGQSARARVGFNVAENPAGDVRLVVSADGTSGFIDITGPRGEP